MPSKSQKQHNLMAMCSTTKGRKRARKLGIKCPPMSVAKEYMRADARKKKGGKK